MALFVRFSEMDLSTRLRRARGRRGAGEDVDADVDASSSARITAGPVAPNLDTPGGGNLRRGAVGGVGMIYVTRRRGCE